MGCNIGGKRKSRKKGGKSRKKTGGMGSIALMIKKALPSIVLFEALRSTKKHKHKKHKGVKRKTRKTRKGGKKRRRR